MANALQTRETGYHGEIRSLANVEGQRHQGRVNASTSWTVTGSVAVLAMPSNPKRIAGFIQNFGDPINAGTYVYCYLGPVANNVPFCILYPGGSLQIDVDLPWTGEVWLYTTINSPQGFSSEISVA